MSLDYPEYEEIRKKSWLLGLLWRISDIGYYLGLLCALGTPFFAIAMKSPKLTIQARLYAAFISIVFWVTIFWVSLQLKSFAIKKGRKLLNRHK
jgi:hypothetical protein